jgi:hypothetical protein
MDSTKCSEAEGFWRLIISQQQASGVSARAELHQRKACHETYAPPTYTMILLSTTRAGLVNVQASRTVAVAMHSSNCCRACALFRHVIAQAAIGE